MSNIRNAIYNVSIPLLVRDGHSSLFYGTTLSDFIISIVQVKPIQYIQINER